MVHVIHFQSLYILSLAICLSEIAVHPPSHVNSEPYQFSNITDGTVGLNGAFPDPQAQHISLTFIKTLNQVLPNNHFSSVSMWIHFFACLYGNVFRVVCRVGTNLHHYHQTPSHHHLPHLPSLPSPLNMGRFTRCALH